MREQGKWEMGQTEIWGSQGQRVEQRKRWTSVCSSTHALANDLECSYHCPQPCIHRVHPQWHWKSAFRWAKLTAGNSQLQITSSTGINSLDKYSLLHDTGKEINRIWSGQQNRICEQQCRDRPGEEGPGRQESEKDMHWANTCGFSSPSPLPVALLIAHIAWQIL